MTSFAVDLLVTSYAYNNNFCYSRKSYRWVLHSSNKLPVTLDLVMVVIFAQPLDRLNYVTLGDLVKDLMAGKIGGNILLESHHIFIKDFYYRNIATIYLGLITIIFNRHIFYE